MEKWYQKLKNRQYEEIILKYHDLLFWRNEKHTFRVQEESMEGKIKGINDRGQLIVEISGNERIFNHKELIFIEVILKNKTSYVIFAQKKFKL